MPATRPQPFRDGRLVNSRQLSSRIHRDHIGLAVALRAPAPSSLSTVDDQRLLGVDRDFDPPAHCLCSLPWRKVLW
jgi:hypothetical protein